MYESERAQTKGDVEKLGRATFGTDGYVDPKREKEEISQIHIPTFLIAEFLKELRIQKQLMKEIKKSIDNTHLNSEPIIKELGIISLGDKKLTLSKKIPIIIEQYEDEIIAKFVDVEVTGFGETEYEAIESLKENIVSLYLDLTEDEVNLGPLPQKWLSVLKEIVVEK